MSSSDTTTFVIQAKDSASATIGRVSKELKTMGGAGGVAGPLGRLSSLTGGFVNPATLAIGAAVGLGAAAIEMTKKAANDSYTYVWKTQRTWTGCRKLTLTFTDGSVQEAIFQLKP